LAGSVKVKYPVKIKQLVIKQVTIKLVASQEKGIGIRKWHRHNVLKVRVLTPLDS
jgi:hypothetical protein